MQNFPLTACTDAIANFWLFDLTIAPDLLYYSYVPISLLSVILGVFVLINNRGTLMSGVLFFSTVIFALFLLNEIMLWIAVPASMVHFGWSLSLLFHLFMVLSFSYFTYLYVTKRDLPYTGKLLAFVLSLPIIALLPSTLNVTAFDIDWCEGLNGPLWYYLYAIEALFIVLFFGWGVRSTYSYLKTRDSAALQSSYLIFGTFFFLVLLFASEFFGEIMGAYEINLIGPVGMFGFIVVLSYLIVRFHAFNAKLLGAQALVVALWFLIGSFLFVAQSMQTKVVASATLVLALIGGYLLIRSVKKEVEQREQIAKLADTLAKANERLKILDKLKSEFVSIASHQLRSPLTSIRGYASMLLEGSYGKLPEKAVEAARNIADSSKYMALSVEDYLNVSRIEAGNMKYEYSDFNLKDMAEKIVDEMRQVALKKGLVMLFRSDSTGSMFVHADIGKTRQIIMNLLDNSMKYTPKGTITVIAHDDVKKKKAYVTIHDTGVGMSKETLEEVFDKFVRAKNANSVNTTGTGLGLYVAKKMITDMKGKVWAESEGEGRGSQFHIEFPMISGPKSL